MHAYSRCPGSSSLNMETSFEGTLSSDPTWAATNHGHTFWPSALPDPFQKSLSPAHDGERSWPPTASSKATSSFSPSPPCPSFKSTSSTLLVNSKGLKDSTRQWSGHGRRSIARRTRRTSKLMKLSLHCPLKSLQKRWVPNLSLLRK